MLFSCKACKAKDAHIETLKEQLRLQTPNYDASVIPVVHVESNAVLSGSTEMLEVVEKPLYDNKLEDELSERDRLLSGSY